MKGMIPVPMAAMIAIAAYLALIAEPGQPEASTVAVTTTDATTANPPAVTAGAQEAPPMGPAVAATIIGNDNHKPALAEPVVAEGIYWRSDLAAAQLEASQRKKPLVRLVTNVATCAPCRALESGPLSDQETIRWLNRNVVMTQRLPRQGESIPFFEVQVRPNVWRKVSIATYKVGSFLHWFREVVR